MTISQISDEKNFILSPDIIKRNGYCKPSSLEKNYYHQTDNHKSDLLKEKLKKTEEPFKFPPVIINDPSTASSEYESHPDYSYNETFEHIGTQDEFGSSETLTNENCKKLDKQDKWYNTNFDNSTSVGSNGCDYSQGYSLFSSGANLLQTAGIHIPSVSTSSSVSVADHIDGEVYVNMMVYVFFLSRFPYLTIIQRKNSIP